MTSTTPGRAWRETIPAADLADGDVVRVEVPASGVGRRPTAVLLARVASVVHAWEDMCPHAGWPISDGPFDGRVITCSRHFWEFDVTSGESVFPPGWRMRRFPTDVNGAGTILVDVTKGLYER